jgi:hypothetical protein
MYFYIMSHYLFFFLSFSMTVYFGEMTASAGPPGY